MCVCACVAVAVASWEIRASLPVASLPCVECVCGGRVARSRRTHGASTQPAVNKSKFKMEWKIATNPNGHSAHLQFRLPGNSCATLIVWREARNTKSNNVWAGKAGLLTSKSQVGNIGIFFFLGGGPHQEMKTFHVSKVW